MIGETVGNFKIVSKLSVGGMGTVYKAEHTLIGKLAAVKVLNQEHSVSRGLVQRFFNEAKATTSIKHPDIVEIFDYGYMASGNAYMTMEFLEGMSLARRIKTRGRTTEGEAAMILRVICSGLAAAHAKGIVHRDLKPDNIFMCPDPESAIGERPKILDFGIAKLTEIGLAGATATGAVMGTPTYMSPEQCRGTGDVDARADLYSLGCIFYELVVGKPPFTNLGAGELIGAHLYVDPEPPRTLVPDLHAETNALIVALLCKDPAERPQTAKELAQRLQDLATKLGWVTSSSPHGVTAPLLTELAMGAQTAATQADPRLAETVPPSDATVDRAGAPVVQTTPYQLHTPGGRVAPSLASLAASLEGDLVGETPTTLSGAASQIDLPRKSRKGLGLAMLAAAVLAGGTVAFVKLGATQPTNGDHTTTPGSVPAAAPSATPPSEPPPSATPASEPPRAPLIESAHPATTEHVDDVPTTPAVALPEVETKKPSHRHRSRKADAKQADPKQPTIEAKPTKPKIDSTKAEPVNKPLLIETDID